MEPCVLLGWGSVLLTCPRLLGSYWTVKVGARGIRLPSHTHTQGEMTGLSVGGPRSSCGGGDGVHGSICMRQQMAEISLTNHRLSQLRLWEAQRHHLSPPTPALATPTPSGQRSWDMPDQALTGDLHVLYYTGWERMGWSPLCLPD